MTFLSALSLVVSLGFVPPSTWWADQPMASPDPPTVMDESWCRNDIDRFILARLESAGLSPAREVDRRTLVRRATYDLTGLPPTPEAVEAFASDERPDAYERLIDSLLASPQYGVKWGRHWLDRVRWAETDGYERDRIKPAAWRYRDWVVASFNDDMPWDTFITHQLAGDEVADRDLGSMVATGFLHLGVRDDEPTDPETAIYDDLDGMLDTTCRVTLGISMGCVRCHAHKRDPIPQVDYYRMLAFFRGLKPYRSGYGNTVMATNYVRQVPLDLGHQDGSVLEAWVARRTELRNQIDSLLQAAMQRPGGINDSTDPVEAIAQPTIGLVQHLEFEDDPALCEAGTQGHALLIHGGADAIEMARPVQNDFTISLAFRPDADGIGEGSPRWFLGAGLVDGEIGGVVDDFGMSWFKGGRVTAGVGNPETFLTSPPGLALSQWHHAALTRQQDSGVVTLWVDGELVDTQQGGTQPLTASAFLTIGRLHPGHNPFNGAIDDVRFYDRVLSDHELLMLHDSVAYGDETRDLLDHTLGESAASDHRALVEARLKLTRPVVETVAVLAAIEHGAEAPITYRLLRGNPSSPAEEVTPGVPMFLGGDDIEPVDTGYDDTTGRRLALARWIVHPENPRTPRVLANQLWQQHFGRGIVPTPDDFGRLGQPPTHPVLLDWLAAEVVDRQWSLKDLHHLLMNSATYRMAATPASGADPLNELWSRFPMRRLTAEEIRDSLLAVNGSINLEVGGPSVYPPLPDAVLATASRPESAWGKASESQADRRTLYIHLKRSLKMPLLESFDMADTDMACPVRFNTTVSTQALTMLNSDFLNTEAQVLADRLAVEAGKTPETMIRRGLHLATQRPAEEDDVQSCLRMLRDLESNGLSRETAMRYVCLSMLNLNAFMYID